MTILATAACDSPNGAAMDAPAPDANYVMPYACPAGSPPVVFVSEEPPPATMKPWEHAQASVTFANCGTKAWSSQLAPPDGVKLGPALPHDLGGFTPTRIALPQDVPPGNAIKIPLDLHAPPITGPHFYGFQLVQDGVAWLDPTSTPHGVDVEPGPGDPVELCTGVMADPTGATDAHAALQSCLDATAVGGTLALPAGFFRLSGVVTISHAMTLTTTGATGSAAGCMDYDTMPCAVFQADASTRPGAAGARGFFRLGLSAQVSNVTLDHIVVDGNRGARLGSPAAAACASGNNGEGINIGANCASCKIQGIGSIRAVCGTGLEWDGDHISVSSSTFQGNGDHGTQNMWSDGLTIHKSDGGVVDHCHFIDNSDVGFISGGGTNASYTNNEALQLTQASFAAIMLDNFNNNALGNHTGAQVTGNLVSCPGGCNFGIELGPHPWYQSANIMGGTVTSNTVVGAKIEINAQGAGTAAAPTVVGNNTLGAVPATSSFGCGNIGSLLPLNVSAESVVTVQGGTPASHVSIPCP
jgi:hypothetical protein